jgi:hypothetical protein
VSTWRELEKELEAWARSRRPAAFWWRDDDAVEPSPALDRLLDLAASGRAPLALAVIPARASSGLAAQLADAGKQIAVLQHGFDHTNHAPDGEKHVELNEQRPRAVLREELARGRAILAALFGERALPVLVPPWNRMAQDLIPELTGLGIRGLSCHTPRTTANPASGLIQCNTHVDVLRWKPERGFLGEGAALDLLIRHLSARRCIDEGHVPAGDGSLDPDEPTGLLTHHLAMDEPAWDFMARLLECLTRQPAVHWVSATEAFAATGGPGGHS